MEIKLTRLRCPNCGSDLEIENLSPDREFIQCTRLGCGATFKINRGIRFAEFKKAEAEKIGKYRREMTEALFPLNRTQASTNAENILAMIPDDYRAKAVCCITDSWFEDQRPLENFLDSRAEATAEEFEEIFPAMLSQCNYKAWQKLTAAIPYYITDPQKQAELKEHADLRMESILEENDKYAIVSRDIFICHSSADNAVVMRVVNALEEDGWKCWISERNMPPDTRLYWEKIKKNISLCRIFLVCCSGSAMLSNPVQREIYMAEEFPEVQRLELKLDSRRHTTLFNHFFEGLTWIQLENDFEASITALKNEVYQILHANRPKLEDILAKADEYMQTGEVQKELEVLLEGEKSWPRDCGLLLRIGRAYRRIGDHDKAMICYHKVEEINPKIPVTFINRGSLYLVNGLYSQAKEQYEKAESLVTENPDSIDPHDLGILYANYALSVGKLGEIRTAEDYLTRAERLGYSSDHIADIRSKLGIVPEPSEMRLQLIYDAGKKLMDTGDYDDALQSFSSIPGYKDADTLAEECRKKTNEVSAQNEAIYDAAVNFIGDGTAADCQHALRLLEQIPGWKNADELAEQCRIRLEELTAREEKESIYLRAKNSMAENTEEGYQAALGLLAQVSGYLDADELAEQCKEGVISSGKEKIYLSGKKYMSENTENGYEQARKQFKQIYGYKDATDLFQQCGRKLMDLKDQQKNEIYDRAQERAKDDTVEGYTEAVRLLSSIDPWKYSDMLIAEYNAKIKELQTPPDKSSFWLLSIATVVLFFLPRWLFGSWIGIFIPEFMYLILTLIDYRVLLLNRRKPRIFPTLLMLIPLAAHFIYVLPEVKSSGLYQKIFVLSEAACLLISTCCGISVLTDPEEQNR